jgi:microcystin-dependent protein
MNVAEPFLSEIRTFSFNFAPKGWALCNGQILPINQNQALFSLLGTTYGGDGQTTFALPNLMGRVPIHTGNGHTLGERGGGETHTLTVSEMAPHFHYTAGTNNTADSNSPAGKTWADPGLSNFHTSANIGMNSGAIAPAGGSQPHLNMQPFLTLNYCIALQGIFPSPN